MKLPPLPDDVQRVIELYLEGVSELAIADELKMGRHKVQRLLDDGMRIIKQHSPSTFRDGAGI